MVGIVSGENFPDALGGGVHSGTRGGPLLLVRRTELPEPARAYLVENRSTIGTAAVYGVTVAVEESTRTAVQRAIT